MNSLPLPDQSPVLPQSPFEPMPFITDLPTLSHDCGDPGPTTVPDQPTSPPRQITLTVSKPSAKTYNWFSPPIFDHNNNNANLSTACVRNITEYASQHRGLFRNRKFLRGKRYHDSKSTCILVSVCAMVRVFVNAACASSFAQSG